MKRILRAIVRTLPVCLLWSAAACSSSDDQQPPEEKPEDKVAITMFQAAPPAIEAGQTAMLKIAIDPPDAQVTITDVGDMTAKTEIPVHPTVTTTYHLTAIKGTARAEAAVTVVVGPQPVVSLRLETSSDSTIAGDSLGVTLTAVALNGLPTPSYRGTVHLSTTDLAAIVPADITFGVADSGVKSTKLELRTSGLAALSATDVMSPGLRGSTVLLVRPAVAASCNTAQAPASAPAGATVGLTVALHDRFGNTASDYTGTVRLTSTDVRSVPTEVTYAVSDGGSHAFSTMLITTGLHTLTATDISTPSIHCETPLAITPGAPKLVLTVPGNARAGFPLPVGVKVFDVFDNTIPNYAGTVSFASSDSAAASPAPLTFTGSEGGEATTAVTFLTRGTQVLSAHDTSSPVATGTAAAAVIGLVYTAPQAGRVRLVLNAAQSTAQVVQLDMIANERIEQSTFFGGGPGSFATGMNLPLDTTRVAGDTPLIIRGPAIPVGGTGTPATAARVGNDHVLYTAVSRKRVAGTVFTQATEVQAGMVFYSVRLKLTPDATMGPVFDGQQPSALFRASVRDQYGDDYVSQTDFGIGKLEVQ